MLSLSTSLDALREGSVLQYPPTIRYLVKIILKLEKRRAVSRIIESSNVHLRYVARDSSLLGRFLRRIFIRFEDPYLGNRRLEEQ